MVGLTEAAVALSAGSGYTCALLAGGGAQCWGRNNFGQLGDGTTEQRLTPVAVAGLASGVVAVTSGAVHTCALTMAGGVQCWGINRSGELGDGTTTTRLMPVAVHGLAAEVKGVSAGGEHTCAVLTAGGIRCWGLNYAGQLGDGTLAYNRLTPVDVWHLEDYDSAAVTEIPAPECRALVTFFKATNGPLWRDHTGWLRTPTPCSWHGVACDAGHVSELDLPANNLVDTLPEALGALSGLQRLDLHGNELAGPLPAALGDLVGLQWLDLSGNDLAGPLPATLGNLGALQYLDLSESGLAGVSLPPELGNLTALRYLDLHGNALGGQIPAQLGAMTALQTLDLSGNGLSGSVPAELTHLVQLRTLDLHANQLSGPLPTELGRLVAVQTLDLSSNALSGVLPASLGDAAALRTLDLHRNHLSGPLPWPWSRLTALERLDLGHNLLTGELPPEWSLLSTLQYLDLSSNALAGWLPPGYGQWTALQTLDLSFNALRGTLPATWGSLSHIQTLSLNNNQLAGAIPAAWGTLGSAAPPAPQVDTYAWWAPPPPGLYLDLSCNRLSGPLPRALGQNPALQVLNLSSNQLRGALPPELQLQRTPHTLYEDNLLEGLPEADSTQTRPPTDLPRQSQCDRHRHSDLAADPSLLAGLFL